MRKVLLGVAAVSMVVAACSRQPEEVTGEPPAEVQINAVHRVDRDAGTAALNVSALNEAGEPIEGHIDRVTATVDGVEPPTTGDRKSTRMNSSHMALYTAVICFI